MRGSHGVCDCDILRRANVKADLYLLRGGGFVRTLRTPPGYGHASHSEIRLYSTATVWQGREQALPCHTVATPLINRSSLSTEDTIVYMLVVCTPSTAPSSATDRMSRAAPAFINTVALSQSHI